MMTKKSRLINNANYQDTILIYKIVIEKARAKSCMNRIMRHAYIYIYITGVNASTVTARILKKVIDQTHDKMEDSYKAQNMSIFTFQTKSLGEVIPTLTRVISEAQYRN